MERRSFFGILAAPFLKRFLPPAPLPAPDPVVVPAAFGSSDFPALFADALDRAVLANYSFHATVNDDLDVFTNLPSKLGVAARKYEEQRMVRILGKESM